MKSGQYTDWSSAVFKWNQEDGLDALLEEVMAFVDEKEGERKGKLIHPSDLEEVVSKALTTPEGGRGYLHVEKRWPRAGGGVLLGYAWIGIEKTCLFVLCHKGLRAAQNEISIPAWLLKTASKNARWDLKDYLKEIKVVPPEKIEQMGNLLFGGFGFEEGPSWFAPAEDPKIKNPLFGLEWEDLSNLKPQTIAKRVAEALKANGISVKSFLVKRALEGKASLLGALELHLLAEI